MKITKPSQLREGMKLKGKWLGIPVSGLAYTANNEVWFLMPHMTRLTELFNQAMSPEFTELESAEGIRAAKEGDVLVDQDGDWKTVLLANDHIATLSCYFDPTTADKLIYTWEELEKDGWKIKGAPNPETDPIEVNGRTYDRDQLLERIKELEPID